MSSNNLNYNSSQQSSVYTPKYPSERYPTTRDRREDIDRICDICRAACPTDREMERHMSMYHAPPKTRKSTCQTCKTSFADHRDFESHLRNAHINHDCTSCGREFLLAHHLKTHKCGSRKSRAQQHAKNCVATNVAPASVRSTQAPVLRAPAPPPAPATAFFDRETCAVCHQVFESRDWVLHIHEDISNMAVDRMTAAEYEAYASQFRFD